MVPLSVAELRRLFFRLVGNRLSRLPTIWPGPGFRRTHQALARLCHYKRRNALTGHLQL